jgi:single-stranded-DNA-specific exonuclease
MRKHHWEIRPAPPQDVFDRFPEQSRALTTLLFHRGILEQKDVDRFLEPEYTELSDPFLFRDMQKAVARVQKALADKEKITIYGDYDADGVCGAAVLFTTLKALGAEPEVYIPYRMTEGYGMNTGAIDEIAKSGSTLIITNDLGITNVAEVAHAKDKGIDVIISDHHHEPAQVPEAFAILNPALAAETYPTKNLCGTGVSFKFASALLKQTQYGNGALPAGWEKWLLDYVAIATVADMVPLAGENRTLVSYGLEVLKKTRRAGLLALYTAMKAPLGATTTVTIGFQIGPRLNAAGRLEHASTAFRLLVTEDAREADRIAQELERTNAERQRLTETLATEAARQIGSLKKGQRIAFAAGEGWPQGVVGIVAGKLVRQYGVPVIVAGKNGKIHGSGRSIPQFNLIEAVERAHASLEKFGGHPQAFGFTAAGEKEYGAFVEALTKEADAALKGKDLQPALVVDAELPLAETTWDLLGDLEKLEPHGQGNPRPAFCFRNVTVERLRPVGKENRHLQLVLTDGAMHRKAIAFRRGDAAEILAPGHRIDVVAEVQANEWNGNQEIQLVIRDMEEAS